MIKIYAPKIQNAGTVFNISPAFSGRVNTNYNHSADRVDFNTKQTEAPVKKETLKKIKALKGPAVLNTGKITAILLEDKGLNPKLITPKSKTTRFIKDNFTGKGDNNVAEFNFITGDLNITKSLASYMSNIQYAAVIAHELDHFINCAKLCKTIGIDKYQNLFADIKTNDTFNRNFWIETAQAVDTEGFDPKPILESIVPKEKVRFGYSGSLDAMLEYLNSPLEKSAYSVQYYIEDALNEKPGFLNHRGEARLIEDINAAFDKAKEETPEISEFKNELIDFLYLDSLRFIHKPLMDLDNKILECTRNGQPVDIYVKKYNDEVKKALLKMQPLLLSNIFNPQKCLEAEATVLKRIKLMLEKAPLEQYLAVAAQKRLAMLKNIDTKQITKSQMIILRAEIKSVEEKIKKLTEG